MRFTAFKDLTRLEQTFLGLPFILAGALLGVRKDPHFVPLLWVLPAFMAARISGMAFNQWIDREIDARNPRTQNRPLPSGRVTLRQAKMISWGGLFIFVLICLQINYLTALLSLLAASLIYVYSYLKRVTASCHFVIGLIHFLGPVMAYTAVTGKINPAPLFLGAAAAFSIIGNEIGYAIQDYAFDCKERLFSFPSRLGIETSLTVITWAHILCPLMLLGAGWTGHLPWIYYPVVPIAMGILGYFSWLVRKNLKLHGSLQGIASFFFVCPILISTTTLLFIILSVVWAAL